MAHPTDYKYINDNKTGELGYEITYRAGNASQTCRIVSKPLENNRRGVYQTRTDRERGLFYEAKDEREAATAIQILLDNILTEIRNVDQPTSSFSELKVTINNQTLEEALA